MGAERDRISLERFQHGVSLAKRALLMLSLRLEEGVVRLDLRDHRLIERLLRRPRTGRCERHLAAVLVPTTRIPTGQKSSTLLRRIEPAACL